MRRLLLECLLGLIHKKPCLTSDYSIRHRSAVRTINSTSLSFVMLLQGLDSGYGLEDDTYNVYDKPWRAAGGAGQAIYRPSKNMDKDIYGDDVEKLINTSR